MFNGLSVLQFFLQSLQLPFSSLIYAQVILFHGGVRIGADYFEDQSLMEMEPFFQDA